MSPTLVQYDAPGWGVGEIWLERGVVVHSELPRPRRVSPRAARGAGGSAAARTLGANLVSRLQGFFAGDAEELRGVRLTAFDGFDGACIQALRRVRRGQVVTYGELAALAGHAGAARAAGTFCGRCALSPFVPTHRVVGSAGIGSYGSLGVDYKRRLLALEGVSF
ncbi:MAG: methylated-DNA--[protein]-cysteine S-methyltransferase [Actinobacteria bacterium]|nr:methylated-DNA--[protein]-cysteine S-methyltransferase [Actinomycetota bacterium]